MATATIQTDKKVVLNNSSKKSISLIDKDTTIEGKITTKESIRIDGTFIGEIRCEKDLIIGATGSVEGDIYATKMFVEGFVKGVIMVESLIHLSSTGKIDGRTLSQSIKIDEGGICEGECEMRKIKLTNGN